MTLTFSIRNALKKAWQIFARHPLFFSTMAFVMIIFNLFSRTHSRNVALMILVIIAVILWSYVWISVSLAAVDGKEDTLTFNSLSSHMPNVREFFTMVGVAIAAALIVAIGFFVPLFLGILLVSSLSFAYISLGLKLLAVLGFIILLIPGMYLLVRLMFATIAYVDRQGSIIQSVRYSWHLVRGNVFWTVFLTMIAELALVIAGSLLFVVGLLVAYPLAILLIIQLYRTLSTHHYQKTHPQG